MKESARGHAAPRAGADPVAAREAGPRRRRRPAGAVHGHRHADERLRRLPLVRRDRTTPRSSGPSCRPAPCCSPSPASPPAAWSRWRSTWPTGSGRRSGRCRWSSRTSSATGSRSSRAAAWCSPRSPSSSGCSPGSPRRAAGRPGCGFRNSTDFGRTDPEFGIDLSFFVFDYPFYRLALGFGFAIVLLALIGSVLTHYVFGGLRLQTPGQKLTAAARVQLSVLLGLFVALKAVAYWLDRYGLVYSDRGEVFTGASYTDVNALLVPKTILVFVAAVCALAFFANIFVRNFLLPAAALVLLLISSLVIGVAYPAIVQQFVVKPSAEREGGPVHRAGHRRDARRLRPRRHRVRRLRPAGDRRGGRHRTRRSPSCATTPRRSRTPGCWTRTSWPTRSPRASRSATSTASRRSSTSTGTRSTARPATTSSPCASSTAPGCRRTRATGSTGTPSTPTATASWPHRRTRSSPAPRAASPTSRPATCPSRGDIDVEQPRIYYGELMRGLLRRRRAGRARRRASSTSPRAGPTTRARSTTPTTARAASRSAASSGS